MAQYTLSAQLREQKGKEAAKKLRMDNRLPAVFYGPNADPMMLTVEASELRNIMNKSAGENIILGLQIETDQGSDSKMVMLKELQTDSIKDSYLHVDFYEISMDKELTLDIPVRLVNMPNGVKDGGILQHVRRELNISCLPDKLVEFIEVDVSGLEIGDSLHIRDIMFPEGITSLQEDKLTVAVVVAPSVSAAEEEEEEEEGAEEGAEKEESEQDTQAE